MKYFLYVLVFLIISCKAKKKEYTVIPPDRFVNLLMDYHLANAIVYTKVFTARTKDIKTINIKDSVIRSHGYTKAIFDSTVSYYTNEPEKYDDIYDSVITRLSRNQAILQAELAILAEKERKKMEIEDKKTNDSILKRNLAEKNPRLQQPIKKK
jgi:hypothetical protein